MSSTQTKLAPESITLWKYDCTVEVNEGQKGNKGKIEWKISTKAIREQNVFGKV